MKPERMVKLMTNKVRKPKGAQWRNILVSFLRVNFFEKTKFFVISIFSQQVPKCFHIHMKVIPRRSKACNVEKKVLWI